MGIKEQDRGLTMRRKLQPGGDRSREACWA